jgi:hypothetical protein
LTLSITSCDFFHTTKTEGKRRCSIGTVRESVQSLLMAFFRSIQHPAAVLSIKDSILRLNAVWQWKEWKRWSVHSFESCARLKAFFRQALNHLTAKNKDFERVWRRTALQMMRWGALGQTHLSPALLKNGYLSTKWQRRWSTAYSYIRKTEQVVKEETQRKRRDHSSDNLLWSPFQYRVGKLYEDEEEAIRVSWSKTSC